MYNEQKSCTWSCLLFHNPFCCSYVTDAVVCKLPFIFLFTFNKSFYSHKIFHDLNMFHWVWILMVHIFLSGSFFSLWFWFLLWFRIFFFKQHIFISKKLIFWWLYPFYLYVELLLGNGVHEVLEFTLPLCPRTWLIFLSVS